MESEQTVQQENDQTQSPGTEQLSGKQLLRSWLNKSMKVEMTDGRTLIGMFLCTDRDRNLILGSCEEYLNPPDSAEKKEDPRILGLAMVPGHHIVSVQIDQDRNQAAHESISQPFVMATDF